MARKLTKEEQERYKTDFDPPLEPAAAKPKAKKAKASEYVPPAPPKIKLPKIEVELFPPPPRRTAPAPAAPAAPAPKKRGHKSPWPDGTELQRVNVFLPVASARRLRAVAAMRGVDLGVVLDELIAGLKIEI